MLRPFHIIFHGALKWNVASEDQPAGFYCGRTLLATTSERAAARAQQSVRDNLDAQTGWITSGAVTLKLEVDVDPQSFF